MRLIQNMVLFSEIMALIRTNESSAEQKLPENMIKIKNAKDRILKGYDSSIRPSDTTKVQTLFYPRQIIHFDEEKGLFILDSVLQMSWHDPRLMWNLTTEYNGHFMQLPSHLLWTPEITVLNGHALHSTPTKSSKVLARIKHTGNVMWSPSIHTQTYCSLMSESSYPYNEVECIVSMGSRSHNGWNIDFTHRDELILHAFRNNNPRWELLVSKAKFRRREFHLSNNTEFYLSLTAYFPMKRRPVPEIEVTRNICILILLLTLSIFWLPPKSSKKILLGGILFVVLSILLVYVACSTKYPQRVTIAVSHLQSTMYILFTTLLLQIFIVFKICKLSDSAHPPTVVMKLLTSSFGTYFCLRWPMGYNMSVDRIQLKENPFESSNSRIPRDIWMLVASALDKLFFVIMSVATIFVYYM